MSYGAKAYIVAGITHDTLQVKFVDIFSEPAHSVTNMSKNILLDVYSLPGTSYAEALESAKEFLRTFPPYKPLYDLYLKTGRQ